MRQKRPLAALALGLGLLLAWTVGAYAQTPVAAAPSEPHVLVPADIVSFRVLNQPDLSMQVRVDESGEITFPYAGTMDVGGMTVEQAAALLGARLEKAGIIRNAEIVGSMTSFGSSASVLGAVNTPGLVVLDRPTTLTQLLARAGGTSQLAGTTLQLRRKTPDGGEEIREINLPELLSGKNPDLNIVVRNNDEFYVPEAPVFYLYGNVNSPGAYPMRRPLTVQQALALGGGISTIGSESRIRIKRETESGIVEVEPELHQAVQPFDTIEVPERIF